MWLHNLSFFSPSTCIRTISRGRIFLTFCIWDSTKICRQIWGYKIRRKWRTLLRELLRTFEGVARVGRMLRPPLATESKGRQREYFKWKNWVTVLNKLRSVDIFWLVYVICVRNCGVDGECCYYWCAEHYRGMWFVVSNVQYRSYAACTLTVTLSMSVQWVIRYQVHVRRPKSTLKSVVGWCYEKCLGNLGTKKTFGEYRH
jgi:hypothetical protein